MNIFDTDEEGEHPDQPIIMDAKSHKIVQRIDMKIAEIDVGAAPNGISYWSE